VNSDPAPRILIVSSSQVYGSVDILRQPINETVSVNPVNHYGASKALSENIAMAYHKEYDLPVIIARPFNHIGRGQDPHFVVPKIIKSIKEKMLFVELGNLEPVRDYLDVRDVVSAYMLLIEKFPNGEIVNIASGAGHKIIDIIKHMERLTGCILNIKSSESFVRKNEILHAVGDASRLRGLTGWRPIYDINDTLRWSFDD
jgi:nucleoside-diphosphate-sugar epimerase